MFWGAFSADNVYFILFYLFGMIATGCKASVIVERVIKQTESVSDRLTNPSNFSRLIPNLEGLPIGVEGPRYVLPPPPPKKIIDH